MGGLVNDVRTWWQDNNNSKEREMLSQILLSEGFKRNYFELESTTPQNITSSVSHH